MRGRRAEIRHVKRYQGVGTPVDSRFKHHFIGWVAKLRTPGKVRLNRMGQRDQGVQKDFHFVIGQA